MVLCHESELDTSMFSTSFSFLGHMESSSWTLKSKFARSAVGLASSAKSSWILMRRVCSFFWWEPFKLVLCKGAKNMMATWNLESARWKK